MSAESTELMKKAPPEEIKRVVAEFARLTNLSSEYSGSAGQYLKNQVERLGLSAKLFRKLRGMEKQDDAKRQAEIRETIHGWIAMGYLDQVDAFDDLATSLRTILEKIGGNPPEPEKKTAAAGRKKADPTLDSLVH